MLFANPDMHSRKTVKAACEEATGRQKERYNIVLLSLQGKSCQDISLMLSVGIKTVQKWLHRYNSGGIKGLKDKPIPGRPSRLTPDILIALKKQFEALKRQPSEHKYRKNLIYRTWSYKKTKRATCKNLCKWLELWYRKKISQERMRTLLHQLGCSLK